MSRRAAIASLLLALACLYPQSHAGSQGAKPQQAHPGLKLLGTLAQQANARLSIAVWYPSLRSPSDIRIGSRLMLAAQNGKAFPGFYPVLLISHDAGGSRFALHDLAEFLARNGFVVIAPSHPGDTADDASLFFTAAYLVDRPRHILAALEAALKDPELAPLCDTSRIGLMGVGSGTATVLQLAGAVPDAGKLIPYCADNSTDPFCSPYILQHMPAMEKELARLHSRMGTAATNPPESPRTIKAMALIAPGLSPLFPAQNLRNLVMPAAIIAAEDDEVYPAQPNCRELRQRLPNPALAIDIPSVGHNALQAPCPQVFSHPFTALCGKTTPMDDEARTLRNKALAEFFRQHLNAPPQ